MGDLLGLMRNARQMLDKAKAAQADLATRLSEGTAGAGLAIATMNGLGELVGLKIDPAAIDPEDTEMLASLIVSAVTDARKKTCALRAEALREATGGMDLSALGLDLTGWV
ncbi:MAG: YbaB/EbfC family nucleoid-associated protein [Planctomycetes bacterium]|nr:YbaB/EbfC family nucleoid-associated protein [Planctomycetota bacterium]